MDIRDISRLSGVSVSTVSRVLNNHPSVKEKTRQRVLSVIEQESYIPNAVARDLVLKQNKVIGLFITDILNMYFSEIIKGVENVTNRLGYSLLISTVGNSKEKESKCMDELIARRACGLIVASCFIENPDLIRRAQEYMTIVAIQAEIDGVDRIESTDEKGTFDVINHLISLGHKDIAIIGYDQNMPTMKARYQGYMKALSQAGLPVRNNFIIRCEPGENNAYFETMNLLQSEKRPTAIHCINEYIACESYRAIIDCGLKIPNDISLTGFDNMIFSQLMSPKLTTVSQPIRQMGEAAAKRLIERINAKEQLEPRRMVFPTELIVRNSSDHPAKL